MSIVAISPKPKFAPSVRLCHTHRPMCGQCLSTDACAWLVYPPVLPL